MVHETDRDQSGNNRALVREALLHDWDPIGISDIPEAKDEYDAYADVVLGMLVNEHATAEDIADYLFKMYPLREPHSQNNLTLDRELFVCAAQATAFACRS